MLRSMYDDEASHPQDGADQTMFVREPRQLQTSDALDAFTDTDDEGVRSDSQPVQPHQVRTPSARLYQSRSSASASSSHFVIVVPPADLPVEALPRMASARTLARRGTLLPLYPTLGGQLYAIAREYGLPSVGGISLYLVDDGTGNGGPRIGDDTWAALWSGFFEDDMEDALPPPPPLSDVFESEPSQRVSSFSYQRRGSGQYPTPPRQRQTTPTRRLPRFSSNTSLATIRSVPSGTFEPIRLPIVAKLEWVVDPQRAKWWPPFLAHAEAVAETTTSPSKNDGPPLPTPRSGGPRPLHLASQLSSPPSSRSLPQPPAAVTPPQQRLQQQPNILEQDLKRYQEQEQEQEQKKDQSQDQIQPIEPLQLDAQLHTASEDEITPQDAPVNFRDAPIIVPAQSVPDALDSDPISSAPDMTTAPTSQIENPPFEQGGEDWAMERVPPKPETTEVTSPTLTDPTSAGEAPKTESTQPDAGSEAATDKNGGQSKPERHTMSATVASLSAAASRLFGHKPRTPPSPEFDVEEARDRLTEQERETALARRHKHRASIDIPRSVKRASVRMTEAMEQAGPEGESQASEEKTRGHKRSTSTPHVTSAAWNARSRPDDVFKLESLPTVPSEPEPASQKPTSDVQSSNAPEYSVSRPSSKPIDSLRRSDASTLRSPIMLDQSLPATDSQHEGGVPLMDAPTVAQLSRQDSVDFNNTLGDLQRALELLSPRSEMTQRRKTQTMHSRRSARPNSVLIGTNDSPSLISRTGAPPVTDSLLPINSVQDLLSGDSESNAIPRQLETGRSTEKAESMPNGTDRNLQSKAASEAALGSNVSYLMAPSATGDLSQSDGTTSWDAPVPDTSGWSTEHTPMTSALAQWGHGPQPAWEVPSWQQSQVPRTVDEPQAWPYDVLASSTEPLHIRESRPLGYLTGNPASNYKEKTPGPMTEPVRSLSAEQALPQETRSTQQAPSQEAFSMQAISSQETISIQQTRSVPDVPAQLMPAEHVFTEQVPSQQASSQLTARSAAPATRDPTSESIYHVPVPKLGPLRLSIPPHDGAWSVRWDYPVENAEENQPESNAQGAHQGPPPPPKETDHELFQTQWLTNPDEASSQLGSSFQNMQPEAREDVVSTEEQWAPWSKGETHAVNPSAPTHQGLSLSQPMAYGSMIDNMTQPTREPVSVSYGIPASPSVALGDQSMGHVPSMYPPMQGRSTPQNQMPMTASTMSPMSSQAQGLNTSGANASELNMEPDTQGSPSPPSQSRHFFAKMSPKFKWNRRKKDDKAASQPPTPSGASHTLPVSMSEEDVSFSDRPRPSPSSWTPLGRNGRRQNVRSADSQQGLTIETPPAVYSPDVSKSNAIAASKRQMSSQSNMNNLAMQYDESFEGAFSAQHMPSLKPISAGSSVPHGTAADWQSPNTPATAPTTIMHSPSQLLAHENQGKLSSAQTPELYGEPNINDHGDRNFLHRAEQTLHDSTQKASQSVTGGMRQLFHRG